MLNIYIASKTKHAPKWRELRDKLKEQYGDDVRIISTWIDEAGPGETTDKKDLALRCLQETRLCDVLICYTEEGEYLKGAFIEIGAALAYQNQVIAVGPVLPDTSTFIALDYWLTAPSIEYAIDVAITARQIADHWRECD